GPDSFTFKANDGTVDSNVATVSITVTPGAGTATVSINDASVQEGDTGETDAVFTISLSAPRSIPLVIDAASADGTAHSPDDYSAPNRPLTFTPGQMTRNITV